MSPLPDVLSSTGSGPATGRPVFESKAIEFFLLAGKMKKEAGAPGLGTGECADLESGLSSWPRVGI